MAPPRSCHQTVLRKYQKSDAASNSVAAHTARQYREKRKLAYMTAIQEKEMAVKKIMLLKSTLAKQKSQLVSLQLRNQQLEAMVINLIKNNTVERRFQPTQSATETSQMTTVLEDPTLLSLNVPLESVSTAICQKPSSAISPLSESLISDDLNIDDAAFSACEDLDFCSIDGLL